VVNSLNQVNDLLQQILLLRPEVTLAVGKDTFVVGTHTLDKKNHLYKQFVQHLRGMGIASIGFSPGITLDELYDFHHFISIQRKGLSSEEIRDSLNKYNLSHINIGFLDYGVFLFEEGKTTKEIPQEELWGIYITGIINGTLKIEELSDQIGEVSLDSFAHLFGMLGKRGIYKTTSQEIVSLCMKKFLEKTLSNQEMSKLLAFINELPPATQEQFISIILETFSKDNLIAVKAFKDISAELVLELFEVIRSNNIDLPENLNNLLKQVMNLQPQAVERQTFGENLVVDDIFLLSDSDMAEVLLKNDTKKALSDTFETSSSHEYQKEISQVIKFDPSEMGSISLPELKREINDDFIEKTLNNVLLEVMSSDFVSETEYLQCIENLKEHAAQFVVTGQYEQVLQIRKLLEMNIEKETFADITSEALQYYSSPEFFTAFIDSLRIMGRQSRDGAWQLCQDYGEMIIPFLMDALINEETQSFRSFLIGLIRQFREVMVTEALHRLNDSRWFVKRNMLYLLNGCNNERIIFCVRPYCEHENPKVSFEAIRCLLSLGDSFALESVKEYLHSGKHREVVRALNLISAYRIKETVPDLVRMLKENGTNEADSSTKIEIIRALGNIADSRSLDAFREILSKKTAPFLKDKLENLKIEIYRTMKKYSYEDIQDIIERGLRSKNEYIRNESSLLIRLRTQ
jgi:hypothetical protein